MMRSPSFSSVLLIPACLLGVVAATAQPPSVTADDCAPAKEVKSATTSSSRAAWMPRGTFGVMTHYLIVPKGNTPAERTADLNRTIDRFDLDAYIRQIEATRADWLIFTLGQCTGYLCSPNMYLEARSPGRCSRRDLVPQITIGGPWRACFTQLPAFSFFLDGASCPVSIAQKSLPPV